MIKKINRTKGSRSFRAVIFALMAALFYALTTPFSKLFLTEISEMIMAGLLYLGAGIGIGFLYLFQFKKEDKTERLTKKDLPYTIAMILLDIAAPILMMFGISHGSAAGASLLGNFEIVATTLIALLIFHEKVSGKLWTAIALLTSASIILVFNGTDSFEFSTASILVILATCCWGLENNCTRQISDKSTYQIVTLKGLCCGAGSLLLGFLTGESFPALGLAVLSLVFGFISYGLSIFLYIRAQRILGAAKTSAYYAAAPFIGMLLSILINGESLTLQIGLAFLIMIGGMILVVRETLGGKN